MSTQRVSAAVASLILASAAVAERPASATVRVSDLQPYRSAQGWGTLGVNQSVEKHALQIGERTFAHGIGTHAHSELAYFLGGHFERFQAWVGVDAEMKHRQEASVVFMVVADGRTVFTSEVMRADTPAQRVDVPLDGLNTLKLLVTDAGNGIDSDHADWAEAVLIGQPPPTRTRGTKDRVVSSAGLAVELSGAGDIVGLSVPDTSVRPDVWGYTDLYYCEPTAPAVASALPNGGMEYRKTLGHSCVLVERFVPTAKSIRWEIELTADGPAWSAPIETHLSCARRADAQIWTTWGREAKWSDPLEAKPLADMNLPYGLYFSKPDGFSVPIVTILDPAHDWALSLVQSPEDTLLDMQLRVGQDGALVLSRTCHRLGEGKTVRFAMDLVAHPADVRAGLGWMVERYKNYFEPPNPKSDQIGGHGAYSGYEGELDVARLKRMGFTVNWKASIDFPYMGLFLPPIGREEPWNRFAGGGGGDYGPGDEGRYGQTTLKQMAEYSARMAAAGFHVLNYFNVTEFGGNIQDPAPPRKAHTDADWWKDPNDLVYATFPDAILKTPRPIGTWGGAVAMDCGDPAYQDFLFQQAKRHVDELPASAGICIDRMDWLVRYNPNADDGVSWIDGPQRSLLRSWNQTLARLGPLMHAAGKVIYVNPLVHRLDLMKEIDGIYDEFGYGGHNLNASTFLGLRKPVICWTVGEQDLRPDPDAYFQRHLYMGAFVTVPLAANDHTILPSEWVDQRYLEYGALFNALRGRKWVLLPRVVTVADGAAKANIFAVPGGFVVPVVFGGDQPRVAVTLRGIAATGNDVQVLHPDETTWAPLAAQKADGALQFDVPLVRGCALVRVSGP